MLYHLLRGRGDRRPFLVPVNVCPVVFATFQAAEQPVESVDIARPHLEIDEERCLGLLGQSSTGYAGLLFVRPYGSLRDRDAFFRAVKRMQPDLLLVDDRCLCPPEPREEDASPWVDATLYSTGARKQVDLGGGGWGVLRAGTDYRTGAPGPDPRTAAGAGEPPVAEGGPPWLDLGAPEAPWEVHSRHAREEAARAALHRRRLNALYAAGVPAAAQLAPAFQGWRFNVLVPRPDELVERLFAAGLFASRHYPPHVPRGYPVASALHARVVNLFNDRNFDEERAAIAVAVVRRHLAAAATG